MLLLTKGTMLRHYLTTVFHTIIFNINIRFYVSTASVISSVFTAVTIRSLPLCLVVNTITHQLSTNN